MSNITKNRDILYDEYGIICYYNLLPNLQSYNLLKPSNYMYVDNKRIKTDLYIFYDKNGVIRFVYHEKKNLCADYVFIFVVLVLFVILCYSIYYKVISCREGNYNFYCNRHDWRN